VLRFIQRCKGEQIAVGPIVATETKAAMDVLVNYVQRTSFPHELRCLVEGKQLSSNSKILALNPFVDPHGILRVGGRLRQALRTRLATTRLQLFMGDLPSARVTASPPFNQCGIDYAGLISLKSDVPRSKVAFKGYLCLFA
jgi:hypothetical protein